MTHLDVDDVDVAEAGEIVARTMAASFDAAPAGSGASWRPGRGGRPGLGRSLDLPDRLVPPAGELLGPLARDVRRDLGREGPDPGEGLSGGRTDPAERDGGVDPELDVGEPRAAPRGGPRKGRLAVPGSRMRRRPTGPRRGACPGRRASSHPREPRASPGRWPRARGSRPRPAPRRVTRGRPGARGRPRGPPPRYAAAGAGRAPARLDGRIVEQVRERRYRGSGPRARARPARRRRAPGHWGRSTRGASRAGARPGPPSGRRARRRPRRSPG